MKLMILRPGALGDTLMLAPAVFALRGSEEIVLVGRNPGLYFLRPYVDLCLDYEKGGWHQLYLESIEALPCLYPPAVDRIVAFVRNPDGLVGKNLNRLTPDAEISILPPFPSENENIHTALYLAEALKEAGFPIHPAACFKRACKEPLFAPAHQPAGTCPPTIVLHPGSGSLKKNYPPKLWLEIVASLRGEPPLDRKAEVTILLGPAEETLRSVFDDATSLGATTILYCPDHGKLVRLLTAACLYLGHDSGITHLAAMLGTPTIALFKGSLVEQWKPLGPRVRVIEKEEDRSALVSKVIEQAKSLIKQ
jgi:hypothetical protein